MAGESLEDQSLIAVLTPLVEHPDAKGRILRIERSLRMCWMETQPCTVCLVWRIVDGCGSKTMSAIGPPM